LVLLVMSALALTCSAHDNSYLPLR
jgi:hypothetical protein